MSLWTLVRFLIGNRQAILDVAASRHGLLLGLLFVLSAGLAREYDGADLWHEPWHLLIPLAASLGSSVALFLLIELAAWIKGGARRGVAARYVAFLQVFWMTAPLAWLYAIPFERFLSPADAVRANLSLLGLVALWRVLLISRAISVLYQAPFIAALLIVMVYADTVLQVIVSATPLPIYDIMGGIRHTEDEQVLHSVAVTVRVLGFLSWPFWLIGAIIWRVRLKFSLPHDDPPRAVQWPAWGLAVLSLGVWGAVLPYTQPEQQNRWQAERLLRQGEIVDGLQFLSARRREDFPPHWDVPPRIGYGEHVPDLIQTIEMALDEDAPLWVRQLFIDKLVLQTSGDDDYHVFSEFQMRDLSGDELRRLITFLTRFPEGATIAANRRDWIDSSLKYDQDLPPSRRALFEEFLRLADQAKPR